MILLKMYSKKKKKKNQRHFLDNAVAPYGASPETLRTSLHRNLDVTLQLHVLSEITFRDRSPFFSEKINSFRINNDRGYVAGRRQTKD